MISLSFLFENKVLDFPTSRQDNKLSCGSSVVQSILAYYGIDERQDDLHKDLAVSKDGISYKNIIKKFKKHKLTPDAGTMSLDMIKEYIDNNYPVIILIQAYKDNNNKKPYTVDDYKDGHYVIVIGYDDQNLVVEDPSLNNKLGYIPLEELDVRWHGYGETKEEKLDHFGIAVVGEIKHLPNEVTKVE